MFPTTIWTTIVHAGAEDSGALERFARRYRDPILAAIRSRGWSLADAEDICQDVFVRLLKGEVLARADASRGRFRGLLLAVTRHVILDRLRRRREPTMGDATVEVPADRLDDFDVSFDEAWALALAERAMVRLREQQSPYYTVLLARLEGREHDRNKLWIARKKLSDLVRAEVAETCLSPEQFADEMARLSLRQRELGKLRKNPETGAVRLRTSGQYTAQPKKQQSQNSKRYRGHASGKGQDHGHASHRRNSQGGILVSLRGSPELVR